MTVEGPGVRRGGLLPFRRNPFLDLVDLGSPKGKSLTRPVWEPGVETGTRGVGSTSVLPQWWSFVEGFTPVFTSTDDGVYVCFGSSKFEHEV